MQNPIVCQCLNIFSEKVLQMLRAGKISKDSAFELLSEIPQLLHEQKIDEEDALSSLDTEYCSACFRQYQADEVGIDLTAVDDQIVCQHLAERENESPFWQLCQKLQRQKKFCGHTICRSCFERIFAAYLPIKTMQFILHMGE